MLIGDTIDFSISVAVWRRKKHSDVLHIEGKIKKPPIGLNNIALFEIFRRHLNVYGETRAAIVR